MATPAHTKDIFVWRDGYWCFREDFPNQPRQTYNYILVEITSEQWEMLRSGASLSSLHHPQRPAENAARY